MKNIFSSLLMCLTLASFFISPSLSASVILDGRIEQSKIYPGTIHTFKVSLPDGYKSGEEACLYLGLDGILCNAPDVIDTLIARGEMPVTVGVYLQPGVITDADGKVLRYNRSNEFDATDTTFARFVETELLPAVEALKPDGYNIKLRKEPESRMIFGLSSGGIAAFNLAWHRPDLFGKVFSGCGTFVPMRGGNDIQAIVRKTEPKPLRICLQDGYQDTWNPLFGSWYEANAMLASALQFAGYDCWFDWAEGGHSVRRATEIFPEVMKRMWSDYPAKQTKGVTGNNYLKPLLENSGTWMPVTESEAIPAAPESILIEGLAAAVYPDGSIAATVIPGSNYLRQYTADGNGGWINGQRFYWLHNYDNALVDVIDLAYDGDGMLWALTGSDIQICDQNGRVRGILELPRGIKPQSYKLVIMDGAVYLEAKSPEVSFSRRLNVKSPVIGQRPESQGQG